MWHHSLLLMNSFNKTEAAVFPFISLIAFKQITHLYFTVINNFRNKIPFRKEVQRSHLVVVMRQKSLIYKIISKMKYVVDNKIIP